MRAGKLRQRLTIQQPTETRGPSGAALEAWREFARVWGAVEPLRGREFFAAQEIHSEVTTRIRIRYLAGITANMRILLDNRIFLILHPPIDQEMGHREMQLMCREIF